MYQSVHSLCRDGTDTQYMQYLSESCETSPKYALSTQPSSLSAFMISKTHIVAQKPHGIQLNAKCAVVHVPYILSLFRPLCSAMITQTVQGFTIILVRN